MAGMNLAEIIASQKDTKTDHFADRLMGLLEEHVPATQKVAFMAKLSSIMESLGDTHPERIAIFNKVHSRLHAENQQR